MMMSDSKLLKAHLPCSMCGSSDAYAIYDDGHGYCHSCKGRDNGDGNYQPKSKEQTKKLS
jgi:twinkle protein